MLDQNYQGWCVKAYPQNYQSYGENVCIPMTQWFWTEESAQREALHFRHKGYRVTISEHSEDGKSLSEYEFSRFKEPPPIEEDMQSIYQRFQRDMVYSGHERAIEFLDEQFRWYLEDQDQEVRV